MGRQPLSIAQLMAASRVVIFSGTAQTAPVQASVLPASQRIEYAFLRGISASFRTARLRATQAP